MPRVAGKEKNEPVIEKQKREMIMNLKKIFLNEGLFYAMASLLVLGAIPTASHAADIEVGQAEAIQVSEGSEDKSGEKENPHARFRDGSMGGMMESIMGSKGKSPHSRVSKKASSHSKRGGHSLFSAEGLKKILELDDAQAKKIKKVFSNYRKDSIMKNASLRVAQIEFDESVSSVDFKVSEVEKKVKARESAATALTMVRVNALVETRGILSKDQFKKFMGMVKSRMVSQGKHGRSGRHGEKGRSHGAGGFGGHGSSRRGHSGGMMGSHSVFGGGHGSSGHSFGGRSFMMGDHGQKGSGDSEEEY